MKYQVMLCNSYKIQNKIGSITTFMLLFLLVFSIKLKAQDIRGNVEVTAHRIQGIDNSVFKDLETNLNAFINNHKWTDEDFAPDERIECNYHIVINEMTEKNVFRGTLSIQASRPVYNTNYKSPTFTIQDSEIKFYYESSTVLQFSDNDVAGTNALISNLTALVAYYTYIVIGFDYDSFELNGGEKYFRKAENVVLNAPKDQDNIPGWEAKGTQGRNRHALINQILNPRYKDFREMWYNYHRKGLDEMLQDPEGAVNNILKIVPELKNLARSNTGSYFMQIYFTTKADEWVNFLNKAPQEEKQKLVQDFMQMDVSNSNKYRRVR